MLTIVRRLAGVTTNCRSYVPSRLTVLPEGSATRLADVPHVEARCMTPAELDDDPVVRRMVSDPDSGHVGRRVRGTVDDRDAEVLNVPGATDVAAAPAVARGRVATRHGHHHRGEGSSTHQCLRIVLPQGRGLCATGDTSPGLARRSRGHVGVLATMAAERRVENQQEHQRDSGPAEDVPRPRPEK